VGNMGSVLSMQTQQREILDRILNAYERVQERLRRSTGLLESAGIKYAVIGGNAVAAWVATRDESLVRATRDVDLLVQREDFLRIREVLESDGFVFRHAASIDMFLDGPEAREGDGVHLVYASEMVRAGEHAPAPSLEEVTQGLDFRIISLDGLVRSKLTSWRDKDRVHLRDMIEVGLIDAEWPSRLPTAFGRRLQELLDNPE
jgi:putative nucleotidyltransferase-like protein